MSFDLTSNSDNEELFKVATTPQFKTEFNKIYPIVKLYIEVTSTGFIAKDIVDSLILITKKY